MANEREPQTLGRIDQLIASCFEHPESDWAPAIEELCLAHPDDAGEFRQRLENLQAIGFADQEGTAAKPAYPDRLGDYRLIELLGGGGMGVVYLAEQESTRRRVALKLIKSEQLFFPGARKRFAREIELASRLDHPGICTVYDAGEAEGTPFIAMRYVEGETLEQKIQRAREEGGKSVTLASDSTHSSEEQKSTSTSMRRRIGVIVELVEQVARALHVAHESGLVHRDIKPGNVMIAGDGSPVILDFGLARAEGGQQQTITAAGAILGTPAYMSPEQVSGKEGPADRRTDVYSLGATLYECLTLERPFMAPSREELYRQILSQEPPDPRLLNSEIPYDLKVILEVALEKNPERRYQTALDLGEDLRRLRQLEPILAKPAGILVRLARWTQRNRAVATLLVLLSLALVATLIFQVQLEQAFRSIRVQALVMASREEMDEDQMLGLILARKAHEIEDNLDTRSQLHRALAHIYERVAFRGHERQVCAIDASPDGQKILTGTSGGMVRLWSRDGTLLREFEKRHGKPIVFVGFVGNGKDMHIVSACRAGILQRWSLEGRPIKWRRMFRGTRIPQSRFLYHAVLSPSRDQILLGTHVIARLLELRGDGFERLPWPSGHDGSVQALAIAPRGRWLATAVGTRGWFMIEPATGKYRVRIWDRKSGFSEPWSTRAPTHMDAVTSLSFSKDGKYLLSGSKQDTCLFELESGKEIRRVKSGSSMCWAAFLKPSEKDGEKFRFLTSSFEGGVHIWTDKEGAPLRTENLPTSPFVDGAVSADGLHFVVPCEDGAARVFNRSGRVIAVLRGHRSRITTVKFLPATGEILTGSDDRTARLWRVDTLFAHEKAIAVALPSPAQNGLVLTAESAGPVRIWSPQGRILQEKKAYNYTNHTTFSPDGKHFAASEGKILRVWKVDSGDLIDEFQYEPEGTENMTFCFIPGTTKIAYCPESHNPIHLRDFLSKESGKLDSKTSPVRRLVADHQGDRLLVLGERPQLIQKDPETAKWSVAFAFEGLVAFAGAFSRSGDHIVLGSDSGPLLLFDRNCTRIRDVDFPGHGMRINWVSFSPDGQFLASASMDGSARIWQIDGTPLATLEGPPGEVYQANFMGEGGAQRLITAHQDGSVRTWFVRTEDLLNEVEKRCIRELSKEERLKYEELLLEPGK